jgi:hypothetical protein
MLAEDHESTIEILDFKRREFAEYQRQISSSTNPSRHLLHVRERLRKQIELDENAVKEYDDGLLSMLGACIEGYAHAIQRSSEYDLFCSLFVCFANNCSRLLSLWFENNELSIVNDLVKRFFANVPSYKFLSLVYQLSARESCFL